MKKIILFTFISSLILVMGCSDVLDMQNVSFASAIGVDYKNGKFYTYLQMVGFTNIAKVDGGASGPQKSYVAKGVGNSPNEALTQILNTAQLEIYFRHITAIVLSESVIQKALIPVYDSLSRNNELTLSPWLFGTREHLEDIFIVNGFFDQTSLETILHKPLGTFKQHSTIKPKQLFELGREISEPHYTTYLPSLAVNKTQWKESKKKEPKLVYNGAFFLQNQHYKGFYKIKQLEGLRWVTKETEQLNILIPNNANPSVSVMVNPKVRYQENKTYHQASLNVLIRGNGYIIERNNNDISHLSEVEKGVSTEIRKEINSIYQLGLKNKTDFLNLEHTLYRNDYNSWEKVAGRPNLLHRIDVNISIKNSSSSKNQELDIHKIE